MLVLVYTCQNATLLEITCHGSFLQNTERCVKKKNSKLAGYYVCLSCLY